MMMLLFGKGIFYRTYSEPYKQVNFFVNFTATDGLARLKGKYLTDDFIAKSNQ
jgi:hypothetical protein